MSGVPGRPAGEELEVAAAGDMDVLVSRVRALLVSRPGRCIVGIVGAPGAGKSTLARAVVDAVNERAVVAPGGERALTAALVPMDGFHLAGSELQRLGRQERKGAPDTFDAAGYVHLLRRLREREAAVYAPEFRREIEEAVAGALVVDAATDVVVTEGNYLLLDSGPWAEVRVLLDEAWFLDLDEDRRTERLVARHVRHGRTPDRARAWASGPDERNAELVRATRAAADLVVRGT